MVPLLTELCNFGSQNFFVQRLVQEETAAPGSSHTGKPPGPACPHPRALLASGLGPYWHPKGQNDDIELNRAALPEPPQKGPDTMATWQVL